MAANADALGGGGTPSRGRLGLQSALRTTAARPKRTVPTHNSFAASGTVSNSEPPTGLRI